MDYMMINRRYRNSVRKAQIIPGCQATMARQSQHGVIRMDICRKLMRKYKAPEEEETGTQVKYDIDMIRKTMGKAQEGLNDGNHPLTKITTRALLKYGKNSNTSRDRLSK